jgi:DeoR family transcriptional regulator of aga operon
MLSTESSSARLRQQAISTAVERDGFARVSELSHDLGVSVVTIRSDLDRLEVAGRIVRVRGGAVPRGGGQREMPFELASDEAGPAKASIASSAADLIESGDTILLDVGTTTTAIARELVLRAGLRDITVFTNSLTIALALEQAADRLQIVVTGGTLRPMQHSLVEPLATTLLDGLHAHLAFIGCNGVHQRAGITNVNLPEASIKRAMLAAARRRVIVADGSKLGEIELARVCDLDEIHLLVTDPQADTQSVDELRQAGLEVIVAGQN